MLAMSGTTLGTLAPIRSALGGLSDSFDTADGIGSLTVPDVGNKGPGLPVCTVPTLKESDGTAGENTGLSGCAGGAKRDENCGALGNFSAPGLVGWPTPCSDRTSAPGILADAKGGTFGESTEGATGLTKTPSFC